VTVEEVVDSVYSKFAAGDVEGMKELMGNDFVGTVNGD
jgi:ketosteroid isomerase-like protein